MWSGLAPRAPHGGVHLFAVIKYAVMVGTTAAVTAAGLLLLHRCRREAEQLQPLAEPDQPPPNGVADVEQRRKDFDRRLRTVSREIRLITHKWCCDVKGEQCTCSSFSPPHRQPRYRCARGCDYDSCAACLATASAQHKHELRLIDREPLEELKLEQQRVSQALEACKEELAPLRRREEMQNAIEHATDALEAARQWAAKATQAEATHGRESEVAISLRSAVRDAWTASESLQAALTGVLERNATSRAGYLEALRELIPRPLPARPWTAEWAVLTHEWATLTKQASKKKWLATISDPANCQLTHNDVIDQSVRAGWPLADAVAYWLLQSRALALSKALREREESFAASLHCLCDVLHAAACRQSSVAPKLFCNLRGKFSLVDNDAQWEKLESPDRTGFFGLTCTSLVKASCGEKSFQTAGFAAKAVRVDTRAGTSSPYAPDKVQLVESSKDATSNAADAYASSAGTSIAGAATAIVRQVTYAAQDSPVVCFESAPPSAEGFHTAVMVGDEHGCFPPNTLYRLKSVASFFIAPSGVRVEQTLYTVSATYRVQAPPQVSRSTSAKMCTGARTLVLADRTAYVRGMEVLQCPPLTLEHEFTREHAWRDRADVAYTLRECWEYVVGPAVALRGCTPGTRDEHNAGKTPQEFQRAANSHIQRSRLWQAGGVRLSLAIGRRGGGSVVVATCSWIRDEAAHAAQLPEPQALLSRDEVLAIRLYTGPACTCNRRRAHRMHPAMRL